jgi:hypothetical protein
MPSHATLSNGEHRLLNLLRRREAYGKDNGLTSSELWSDYYSGRPLPANPARTVVTVATNLSRKTMGGPVRVVKEERRGPYESRIWIEED